MSCWGSGVSSRWWRGWISFMLLTASLTAWAADHSKANPENESSPTEAEQTEQADKEEKTGQDKANQETETAEQANSEEKKEKEDEEEVQPADLEISGYGFWGNRELKKALRLLQPGEEPAEYYDASFVEDSVLILFSKVVRDGYLRPEIKGILTLADGTKREHMWTDRKLTNLLPRPTRAKRVHFIIEEGVLYYYENIEFTGLESMTEDEALPYFVEIDSLIKLKKTRIYTPDRLKKSLSNIQESLIRDGFQQAEVTYHHPDDPKRNEPEINHETGEVNLVVAVKEGPKTIVRSVKVAIYGPDGEKPLETSQSEPQAPYSRFWQQDLSQDLRADQYREGYPDATAEVTVANREEKGDQIFLDMEVKVQTGPKITLGKIKFIGNEKTKRSVMKRQVELEEGGELDRTKVEAGRNQLSRLGIFERVSVRYEKVDETTRNVVYEVQEGKELDFSVLFGYGSYELLRGGVELRQNNVFGLAHQSRLRAIQSMKSSSADYLYTMPRVIGTDASLFFNASGLRREEIDFVRQEVGGGVGVQRFFTSIASDIGLRYNYEYLNAQETSVLQEEEGLQTARVAAFVLDFKHDQRDNPLIPREGYKVFSNMEFASASLGGQVDYQRIETGTSFHFQIGRGRFVHLGLKHGAGLTLNGEREELPFNKRFFTGGENSVRGYQQGQAGPRNEEGRLIGAATYLQGNIELEQMLTPSWSLVVFLDGVGFARNIEDYPFDQELFSVGGGIRWKTIIGPARLEYGYNLNPREEDPSGTVHFSIGFPF